MIKVYFEQKGYAEMVAIFEDDATYNACVEALEKKALEYNFEFVSESVTEVGFDELQPFIDKLEETEPEKTYYLFGEDAVREYHNNGVENIKSDGCIGFGTLVFIEGVTKSTELVDAMNGWMDYAIITEEEFEKLNG
jgi:hypothetical protein